MGISLGPDDIAFRCNLVNLSEAEARYSARSMKDYSSDEIPTAESGPLLAELRAKLGGDGFEFYPGISYRHLLVWRNGSDQMTLTPPHDISDRVVADYLPQGPGSEKLMQMMEESYKLLKDHPINVDRRSRGLRPANSAWLWGQGRKPHIPSFQQKFGLKGAVISAVDLTRGLGVCAGMKVVDVPGATGNIHTNFRGKAQAAIEVLEEGADFVYVHVEAPDEAGHRGELETKIRAIEAIDREILSYLLENMGAFDDYRILLMPDHPTPLSLRTHVDDPVPFVIYQKSRAKKSGISMYSEESARSQDWMVDKGHTLMNIFLGRND
jgi:2,3-bisphosphoglycerate-independent phosphoglycerate mutase